MSPIIGPRRQDPGLQRPWAGRRLHFVGIGGAGMSGLAVVSEALGASVTGSDAAESPYLERVRAVGIAPAIGHAAANVPEDAELVVSTAIREDNPERAAARACGLRELHRGELLGEVTALRRCIAVTGTHGKSTTAAMVVRALRGAGRDPSYLVGAELTETATNAEWTGAPWLVVEADESDRSLLHLRPDIAVLTNLELDHHTTYASRADLDDTVRRFLEHAVQAVVWDRPELLALRAPRAGVTPFAVEDVELGPGVSRFEWRGQTVRLPVPGHHNALNAVAALEAVRLTGADPAAAAAALADFRPAARRFERVGETDGGALVYDDYAHHPTEVAATLAAARTLEPRRLVAAFQPHLYSRTAALWREFGAELAAADLVVVLDVYPAREDPADWRDVSGELIVDAARHAAPGLAVSLRPTLDDAEGFLRENLRAGDLLVTLGAGDVDALARRLVA